jgi:hypothetical protein
MTKRAALATLLVSLCVTASAQFYKVRPPAKP